MAPQAGGYVGGPNKPQTPNPITIRASIMDKLAADTFDAINKCRLDSRHAIDELQVMRSNTSDGIMTDHRSGVRVELHEGLACIDEALRYCGERKSDASHRLVRHPAIDACCQQFADLLGQTGKHAHDADGLTLSDRLSRFGVWGGVLGQNVSLACTSGVSVVCDFLIDDGNKSRSRRRNLLMPE